MTHVEDPSLPYVWEQTMEDASLIFHVPKGTPGKLVNCKITQKHLFLAIKGKETLVDGDLPRKILEPDCSWTITDVKDEREIIVNLVKETPEWWECAIVGHKAINLSKDIQPDANSAQYLEPEVQREMKKIYYDQYAQSAGLPTSKDIEQEELVQKFQREHQDMMQQIDESKREQEEAVQRVLNGIV